MNAREVADKLHELWENNGDLMSRIDEVRSDIERNGGFFAKEKDKLLDLKIEVEDIAWELGKILSGVRDAMVVG